MLGDALLVDVHERGHGARRSTELAHAGRTKEQLGVACAAALVDVHELRLQVGQLRDALLLERGKALAARLDRRAAAGHRGLRLAHALLLQLALHLELPQVAEQRARLSREAIGLRLEHADPIGHAPRLGFGARAVRCLRGKPRTQRQRDDARERTGSHGPEG